MKYYDCYSLIDRTAQTEVDKFYHSFRPDQSDLKQSFDNFFFEHFIEESSMDLLGTYFLNNFKSFDSKELRRIMKDEGYKYTLCGGEIKIPYPKTFGGVIKEDDFIRTMTNHTSKYLLNNSAKAKRVINEMIGGYFDPKYKNIEIKKADGIIWLTWNETHMGSTPLEFMKTSTAEEACAALGLGFDVYKGKNLLAFEFGSKESGLFKRPTVCDSGFNIFWRPTPLSEERFGRLEPLNGGYFVISKMSHKLDSSAIRLPEMVVSWDTLKIKNINSLHRLKSTT